MSLVSTIPLLKRNVILTWKFCKLTKSYYDYIILFADCDWQQAKFLPACRRQWLKNCSPSSIKIEVSLFQITFLLILYIIKGYHVRSMLSYFWFKVFLFSSLSNLLETREGRRRGGGVGGGIAPKSTGPKSVSTLSSLTWGPGVQWRWVFLWDVVTRNIACWEVLVCVDGTLGALGALIRTSSSIVSSPSSCGSVGPVETWDFWESF